MDFPLSLDDFLPLNNTSKTIPCKYKDKTFRVTVTHRVPEEYFVEIIPDDKTIKDVRVGHYNDLYTVWTSALRVLDVTIKDLNHLRLILLIAILIST